ncbi:PAS and ANTAR domain-containing protein [Promicromonospora kroppenstedtii]|uniref:histidine kinase n=1 Tax=Promicromonospora kroppenstedtii TaxID=440482 RepID=A0ABW7XFC5_9MICO
MTEPMEIERALALGANHVVGRYSYDLAEQVWWWSDETYRIHGFEPGDVVPTTALVLAHKHPQDRARVSQVLQTAARTGEPFSSVHRIMDAHGDQKTLTVVGQGRIDPDTTQVSELTGFFVDITAGIEIQANEAASASIRSAAATRAPIEQAKGIISLALHIDPEEAFERLRSTSNHTNVAVRELARSIVALASASGTTPADIADALA